MPDTPSRVVVDVVSDVVCPWCFLGKRRLEQALAALPGTEATIRWRPFQLDPTIPAQGMDRGEYMARKFGSPARLADAHRRLEEFGRDTGIAFAFEAIGRSPNTLAAHRLIRRATEHGVADAVVEGLFTAYFEQGSDIGDVEVLADIAARAGLDRDESVAFLKTDLLAGDVEAEIGMARDLGVQGVPFFIVAGRYALSGAQAPEVLRQVIEKALAEGDAPQAT
jgi:predicted DsbA family dithiol-disulfide isomerase